RTRHTRCYRDWSSDVCSSDLRHHCCCPCHNRPEWHHEARCRCGRPLCPPGVKGPECPPPEREPQPGTVDLPQDTPPPHFPTYPRSEERRVGQAESAKRATET